MKPKISFDIRVLQFQSVQLSDEAYHIPKDVAIDLAEFKYRTFQNIEKANKAISLNAFYDSASNACYVQSKNQILSKKFVGEKIVGMFVTESKFLTQIINVKISISIIKQPSNNSNRAEIISTNEIELPSLKPMETIIIPFTTVLEQQNYESIKKNQRENKLLRSEKRWIFWSVKV